MKVTDKSKIFEIKADLEVKAGIGKVNVEGHAHADVTKDSLSKNTETTIAVNWSGGGSIKEPSEPWTMESMTKVAAAFPDLVAMTPQRTYAILTKYTALESFQRQIEDYSILDYENASIYTGMLLDHYMDYKMMWKQLGQATTELERGTAKIEFSEVSADMADLAKVKPLPDAQLDSKLKRLVYPQKSSQPPRTTGDVSQSLQASSPILSINSERDSSPEAHGILSNRSDGSGPANQQGISPAAIESPRDQDPENETSEQNIALQQVGGAKRVKEDLGDNKWQLWLKYEPFKPNFVGLINARKVCRIEMAKIVNEVDLITKKPKYAIDANRDAYFLHPLVFKQILPVSCPSWTDGRPG